MKELKENHVVGGQENWINEILFGDLTYFLGTFGDGKNS